MYRRPQMGWLKHWDFMLCDLICLIAAYMLAYLIRNGTLVSLFPIGNNVTAS